MEACWHPEPNKRPSFTQILPILDSVLVDCLVDDAVANKFWKDNFLGHVMFFFLLLFIIIFYIIYYLSYLIVITYC